MRQYFDLSNSQESSMMRRRGAISLVLALFGLAGILVGVGFVGDLGPAHAQREVPSACNATIDMSAQEQALACEEVPVAVTFTTQCPVCPEGMNAVFVLLSQSAQAGWQASESEDVLDQLERYATDNQIETVNMAVIHYDNQGARVVQALTDDWNRVRSQFRVSSGYIAQGAAVDAANEAVRMLRQARQRGGGQTPCELVVMYAHVKSHDPHGSVLREAGDILKRAVDLFMVGCPIDPGAWYCQGPEPDMPRSQQYYAMYSQSKMGQITRREIADWGGDVRPREVAVTQRLAPGLEYVTDSANEPPTEVVVDDTGTRLGWTWSVIQEPAPPTLTYRVKPLAAGSYTLTGDILMTDMVRRTDRDEPDELPILAVEGECSPATPTPTPTLTPVPTDTPVVPTETPRPDPIYLPIALSEACDDRVSRADVALVVDVSTSMNRLTRDNRTKLRATQDAVHTFLDMMDLGKDEVPLDDRVAIVGFNRHAWIETELTSDAAAAHAAVERLPDQQAEFTRLDLAFERGAETLLNPDTMDPTRTSVLVVLTDGLPNQVPYAEDGTMETTVLNAAAAAKEAGIRSYTVAVGQPGDTNDALLIACASDPADFFRAEDAEDLAAIYAQIASTVLCPRGRHDWDKPWP